MPPQTLDLDKLFPVAMMHTAVEATRAPVALLDFDAVDDRSRAAAARVVEAYRAAMASAQAPSASMWKYVEEQHGEFLAAVRAGDVDTVLQSLRRLFHTHLIWGLGRVHEQIPVDIQHGHPDGLQIQLADVLVSLGEATGAALITNIEQQGRDVHFGALRVDLDQLLASVITRTGLVVDMPEAGGNYGCVVAGRRVSIDTVVHAYTVHRLKQLGVGSGERIVEIGGGYGCLAYSCRRNGFADYTVFDLPWVNILQGYLHIMTLAPEEVSLFGEPDRPVKIRPFWEFSALGDRSVDVVINTDSMPEIGAATARQYIDGIARVTRRFFLSINQEAMADYPGIGRQQHVNGLAERAGLRLQHRHRYWMRQGYVEEIFAPAR